MLKVSPSSFLRSQLDEFLRLTNDVAEAVRCRFCLRVALGVMRAISGYELCLYSTFEERDRIKEDAE